MILEQIRGFGIGSTDRVLRLPRARSMLRCPRLFMALLAGGSLVLVSKEVIRDGHSLVRL